MSADRKPFALPESEARSGLEAMARPGGGFAMLAMDQRVSLENIFADAGLPPGQPTLDAFRTSVARTLGPMASAILLDPGYVERAPSPPPWRAQSALVVAGDELEQARGRPASDSSLNRAAAPVAVAHRAVALKLMVVWDPGRENSGRVELMHDFVSLAHENGLLAIVEGVVVANSATDRARATADELLAAAATLSEDADLYKAQVPVHGGDAPGDVTRLSNDVTAAVPCPWVVLSTGVPPERFEELLAAACRGGASGFLAGRAIWRPAVGLADPDAYLEGPGAARLAALAAVVDAEARPWTEAGRANDRPDAVPR